MALSQILPPPNVHGNPKPKTSKQSPSPLQSGPLLNASEAAKITPRQLKKITASRNGSDPPFYQPFLNVHKAAAFLGLSVATLARYRMLKIGPTYFLFGRTVRYRIEELTAYAANNRVEHSRITE